MTRFYLKQQAKKTSLSEDVENSSWPHQPTLKELMDAADKRLQDAQKSESKEQNNTSLVDSVRPRFNQD